MKKILVVSCTQHEKSRGKNLLINKSLDLLKHDVDHKMHYENTTSLSVVYNKYITHKHAKKYDIALFVHDDVYIDDLKLRGKLYEAKNNYDIIGLAGCLSPVVKKPALWHMMSDRSNWRGFVAHVNQNDITTINMTSFGSTPSRVVMIDGLFMAVNLKRALETGWRFNEQYSFHHYDLASCLDANKLKMRLGVIPVSVIHASPGLRQSNLEFNTSQEKFIQQYG